MAAPVIATTVYWFVGQQRRQSEVIALRSRLSTLQETAAQDERNGDIRQAAVAYTQLASMVRGNWDRLSSEGDLLSFAESARDRLSSLVSEQDFASALRAFDASRQKLESEAQPSRIRKSPDTMSQRLDYLKQVAAAFDTRIKEMQACIERMKQANELHQQTAGAELDVAALAARKEDLAVLLPLRDFVVQRVQALDASRSKRIAQLRSNPERAFREYANLLWAFMMQQLSALGADAAPFRPVDGGEWAEEVKFTATGRSEVPYAGSISFGAKGKSTDISAFCIIVVLKAGSDHWEILTVQRAVFRVVGNPLDTIITDVNAPVRMFTDVQFAGWENLNASTPEAQFITAVYDAVPNP